MSQWNTLHIFSPDHFKSRIIGFEQTDSIDKLYHLYKSMSDPDFGMSLEQVLVGIKENLPHLNAVLEGKPKYEGAQRLNVTSQQAAYLAEFIDFLIFQTSVNFFPYFKLGGRHFYAAVKFRSEEAVSYQLIHDMLFSGIFTYDDVGIRKVFNQEQMKMLVNDLDNLCASDLKNQLILDEFKAFVTSVHKEGYGLLSAQGTNEHLGVGNPSVYSVKGIEKLAYLIHK